VSARCRVRRTSFRRATHLRQFLRPASAATSDRLPRSSPACTSNGLDVHYSPGRCFTTSDKWPGV
jgi:hypothetical protein